MGFSQSTHHETIRSVPFGVLQTLYSLPFLHYLWQRSIYIKSANENLKIVTVLLACHSTHLRLKCGACLWCFACLSCMFSFILAHSFSFVLSLLIIGGISAYKRWFDNRVMVKFFCLFCSLGSTFLLVWDKRDQDKDNECGHAPLLLLLSASY